MKKVTLFSRRNFISFSIVWLTILCASKPLYAQLDGWSYRLPVSITEQSGTTLTDYQVALTLNTQALISAGKMRSDGFDLRFAQNADGSNPLFHWIESGINTASTKIWVRVPSLAASSSVTIYMFYSNSRAASGSNVEVFDGPYQSLKTLTTGSQGSGTSGGQYGWQFVTTGEVLVTGLGKNNATHVGAFVTLFDFSTKSKLCQEFVPEGTGWVYAPAQSPVWLIANTNYVVMQNVPNGSHYFFTSPTTQGGAHLQYISSSACNGCDENTFSSNNYPGYHYGYADIEYRIRKQAGEEPTFTTGTEEFIQEKLQCSDEDYMICINDTVVFTGPAGYTNYDFYLNNTSIQNGSETQYVNSTLANGDEVKVIVSDGSKTMNSNTIKMTVSESIPVADYVYMITDLTVDFADSSKNALSHFWEFGDGTTDTSLNPSHTYVEAGAYKACLTVTNQCGTNKVCKTLYVGVETGMGSILIKKQVHVYPNPAANEINVKLNTGSVRKLEVALYDIRGKLLSKFLSSSDAEGIVRLPVASLPEGVYFLRVRTDAELLNEKVLITRY